MDRTALYNNGAKQPHKIKGGKRLKKGNMSLYSKGAASKQLFWKQPLYYTLYKDFI